MEATSFFFTIFILFMIVTITIYSTVTGFGPESKNLIDPFEEHQN